MNIDLTNLKRYTVGFAFNQNLSRVILIRKNRPESQKGRLNGIGGKIELGESPIGCMIREFFEETGAMTIADHWYQFHYERHPSGTCLYFFAAKLQGFLFDAARSTTDEQLEIYDPSRMAFSSTMYNLSYLVPMAMCYLQHPEHRFLEG
jgi:8-oxo-dGTP diphosphatase